MALYNVPFKIVKILTLSCNDCVWQHLSENVWVTYVCKYISVDLEDKLSVGLFVTPC